MLHIENNYLHMKLLFTQVTGFVADRITTNLRGRNVIVVPNHQHQKQKNTKNKDTQTSKLSPGVSKRRYAVRVICLYLFIYLFTGGLRRGHPVCVVPNPLVSVHVRRQLISGSHSENVSALACLLHKVTEYRLMRI